MRLSSTNMDARKMLFAAILSICALSTTFKATLDGRIQAIQEESQQFPNPNEIVPPESNEQQRLLRISLRICGTVVESLPMARCAPKCEKKVQALLCQNLNVKSTTLTNATSSRRIRFQDDLVTKFYTLVGNQFAYSSISKAERVEFIRESLVVLRMPPRQFFPILIAAGKRLLRPHEIFLEVGSTAGYYQVHIEEGDEPKMTCVTSKQPY
ncbi:unnamed protein product [Brassica oleracea var. botrytis]|uniref:ATP synthase protein MI25 n=1 Tax=Brassica napus TaxID=3708 RepID=A0A816RMC2_BRANA|nr:unnamed protein product [Brassica napus]